MKVGRVPVSRDIQNLNVLIQKSLKTLPLTPTINGKKKYLRHTPT